VSDHRTDDPIAFGARLKVLREGRGMSRETLGGLVGRSGSWVKGVEVGRLGVPKLHLLLAIAEALRLRDLSKLTGGDQPMPVSLFGGPGHPRLPEVRAALDLFPLPALAPGASVASPASLRARLDAAWAARHGAPNHREVLGRLLPDLLRDAQVSALATSRPAQRRQTLALLSEVYALSQFFLAYQDGAESLLWRAAERSLIAAQESQDARAIGVATWLAAQAHRDHGDWDAADDVTRSTLEHLDPTLDASPRPVLAIYGALQFEAGYTAARAGRHGEAWGRWDAAGQVAAALPADFYDPITSFSRAIMGAHAVTVAVELRSGPEGVRQAAAADAAPIPSRPRRARHLVEEARAYQLAGQPDAAIATLAQATASAPETVKWNGYAKRIVLEEIESRSRPRRRQAAVLAQQMGLLSA
jgi:transcriptional regulator with XRE-family HTH domain